MKRVEDIKAWQRARELASEVYKFTKEGGFERDWGLRDQIRRSAVSVMANIAERFVKNDTMTIPGPLPLGSGRQGENGTGD